MPRSPLEGLMLPTKANSRMGAIVSSAGKTMPVKAIKPGKVVLQPVKGGSVAGLAAGAATGEVELDNDVIFAMLGAELPTKFLKSIGIKTGRKGH